MNKIKLILLGIGALLAIWIASWFGLFSLITSENSDITPDNSSSSGNLPDSEISSLEASQSKVIIDFGDGKIIEAKEVISEPATAYSLLLKLVSQNNLEIKTKKYDFGIFVESIDGYVSSQDKAWIYFVNGQSGTVAADQKEIVGLDVVEWKYISPSEE